MTLLTLVRTNDAVLLSAIEALLTEAHIPYLVSDRNVSALAGSIGAFQHRILVRDCCLLDARRLLDEAGYERELSHLDEVNSELAGLTPMSANQRAIALVAIIFLVVLALFLS